jgi:YD repeat-containing protein
VYNEGIIPPCRNSPAQDYWGYYNGATENLNLIPTTRIPANHNIVFNGADRHVNPAYTQFAIMKRINYPAGGYTIFDYENNDSDDINLPKVYTQESPYIAEEGPFNENEPLPVTNQYETTFVINNPPDKYLNNYDPNGGAYVSGDIQNLGVPPGSSGANVIIERISPASPRIQTTPISSFQKYYLPNGTYRLRASFNQNPPNYQEFWVILNYERVDTTMTNRYIGGLRVSKVSSYANNDPLTIPKVEKYEYTESPGSNTSSGTSFLNNNFNFTYTIPFGPANCVATLMKIRSYSNQPQVSHSGSFVGYRKVFVKSSDPTKTGLASFAYSTRKDELFDDRWPFPPAQSTESFRGQLLESCLYRAVDNGFTIVKRSTMQYTDSLLTGPRFFSLKTNSEQLEADPVGLPQFYAYELAVEWSALAKQTDRTYNPADTTKYIDQISEYSYDPLSKQMIQRTTLASDGKVVKTKNYYPNHLVLNGPEEAGRQWLVAHNDFSSVLREETFIQDHLSGVMIRNFKNFDGINLVKENERITYVNNETNKRKLFRDYYDNKGNLAQYHDDLGLKTCYIWSYNGQYPVTEIKNAELPTIISLLGGQTAVDAFTAQVNPDVNTFLAPLRSGLPDAQVTTFTYKPLVGLTSSTDAKGMTTYYEYDAFQRLRNIKDQNGNILKQTDYHYKN